MTTTECPFRNVPYDVLREIFLRCLPEDRLEEPQPSTRIAPMLLCHVCASWRVVALSNPFLWTHLHIQLPIRWYTLTVIDKNLAALQRVIAFMKWWKMNHGSIAPFLWLNVHRKSLRDSRIEIRGTNLDSEIADFLFDYLSSAQYLDVGFFYPYLIQEGTRRGMRVVTPKLHTLVSRNALFGGEEWDDNEGVTRNQVHYTLPLPYQLPPTLRRLSIDVLSPMMGNKALTNWSTLTHLSFPQFYSCIEEWFSILSALKNIQWGHFEVRFDDRLIMDGPPPNITLPSLATLTVVLYDEDHPHDPYPFTVLFQNVHLPALRVLSLSSWYETWNSSGAATDVSNMLKSAPGVTKLVLGCGRKGFLCFGDNSGIPTRIDHYGPPLMQDAPNLTHLQVELQCENDHDTALLAKKFIQEFFLSTRWLDLAHPANTIRTVTIVIKTIEWDVDSKFEEILKALLIWNIDQQIKNPNNVRFEIASEEKQGMVLSERMWRTWGSEV